MKFGELIEKYAWDELKDLLFKIYSDEKIRARHYAKAYADLKKLKPLPTRYELHVTYFGFDEVTGFPRGSVGGVMPDLKPEGDEFFRNDFALDLTDWGEWLNMTIHPTTLERMPEQEIIVHCLYEMTWCGYTNAYIQLRLKGNCRQ